MGLRQGRVLDRQSCNEALFQFPLVFTCALDIKGWMAFCIMPCPAI